MQEVRSCANDVANAIGDGLRQIVEFSYAIMPRDLAHAVGDLEKTVLSTVRAELDRDIEWLDERLAGADRLRDEWREKCRRTSADATSQPGI
jgi:hypothetical protein